MDANRRELKLKDWAYGVFPFGILNTFGKANLPWIRCANTKNIGVHSRPFKVISAALHFRGTRLYCKSYATRPR